MRSRMQISTSALVAGLASMVTFIPSCAVRDVWQKPEHVIDLLDIAPGARVADIGAGDGYFIPYLAEAVGPDGMVFAVDVEEEKVEGLEALVSKRELSNVEVVLAPYDDPSLPDGEIDLVLIVNTYHHIEDRLSYFERVRESDLANGARVVVIEPDSEAKGVVGMLVGQEHASSAPAVRSEMHEAGFALVESRDDLVSQIFEVFRPQAP